MRRYSYSLRRSVDKAPLWRRIFGAWNEECGIRKSTIVSGAVGVGNESVGRECWYQIMLKSCLNIVLETLKNRGQVNGHKRKNLRMK